MKLAALGVALRLDVRCIDPQPTPVIRRATIADPGTPDSPRLGVARIDGTDAPR